MKEVALKRNYTLILAVFASGLLFIGHGALAAQQYELWVTVFATILNPFIVLEHTQVASLTQNIGILDIIFGCLLLLVGAIVCFSAKPLHPAWGKSLLVLLIIAAIWQFFTSFSFVLAGVPEGIWLFFERSPSFILPAAGALLLKKLTKMA